MEKKHWPFDENVSGDKCLVYSFGIDWDFKFDDAIAGMGCEVHAFDPCKLKLILVNFFTPILLFCIAFEQLHIKYY